MKLKSKRTFKYKKICERNCRQRKKRLKNNKQKMHLSNKMIDLDLGPK